VISSGTGAGSVPFAAPTDTGSTGIIIDSIDDDDNGNDDDDGNGNDDGDDERGGTVP
jgi:hypothetical protein